jgi:hypothetical protein
MMTTFSAMRLSLPKGLIIGMLLVLLQGCSALRLVYANGPQLAWWWLDGYVDFGRDESVRAKDAIDRLFAWHRRTQLNDVAAVFGSAATDVLEPATPAGACRWQRRLRDLFDPTLEQALQQAALLVPGLGEAQFRHIEQRFAKVNAEMKRDYMQADADERAEAGIKRIVDRFEQLYGRIGPAQREAVAAGVAASPFDARAWLGERERWQQEALRTLRRLVAERAEPDRIVAALRVLIEHAERSPDPAYRAYQQKLAEYNCGFAARLHNATTRAQRDVARARLKGWEEDLRALAADAPAAAPN